MFNTFQHVLEDIRRWLREDKSADARFSMMVDLYGLPRDFPGYTVAIAQSTGLQQVTKLQQSLFDVLADSRFIPYLQVHEFEALVLVEPQRLSELYADIRGANLEALCRDCAQFATPEDIDHGQHSHPKHRIRACVPEYDENVAGPLIAESIGLDVLREKCPNFGDWLTRLETA